MQRTLITEVTIRNVIAAGKKKLDVPKGAIITPLASELAASKGVQIHHQGSSPDVHASPAGAPTHASGTESEKGKIVVFGSDHGGYQLKEQLKKYVEGIGFKVLDVGTHTEEACDYPDFAYAVAKAVSTGEAWRGVMIDGAGIGSCVVANKVPKVKAACCHNEFVARNAREHNDTNVLTLGSRVTGSEVCKEILKVWLETWFAGGRHKARVEKIDQVEKRFLR
jgi:ribose 5-phosphate isomerase B